MVSYTIFFGNRYLIQVERPQVRMYWNCGGLSGEETSWEDEVKPASPK